jgi:hypothetical protein
MEQKLCEARDGGYSDCENLATRTARIDGEQVPACAECHAELEAIRWEYTAAMMR